MNRVEISSGVLFIGPAPYSADLKENGPFDLIWNLAEGFEYLAKEEQKFATKVLLASIRDYSVPADVVTFRSQLFDVINALKKGDKVLLHCAAGHGRTGMALACIKFFVDNFPVEECLTWTQQICRGPENQKQIEFVRAFCK